MVQRYDSCIMGVRARSPRGIDSEVNQNRQPAYMYAVGADKDRPADEMHEAWRRRKRCRVAQPSNSHWLGSSVGMDCGEARGSQALSVSALCTEQTMAMLCFKGLRMVD